MFSFDISSFTKENSRLIIQRLTNFVLKNVVFSLKLLNNLWKLENLSDSHRFALAAYPVSFTSLALTPAAHATTILVF
jgi:hypothetical protein